jgi:hypothetical protein
MAMDRTSGPGAQFVGVVLPALTITVTGPAKRSTEGPDDHDYRNEYGPASTPARPD